MPAERPVVAHFMRAYLSDTLTFIYQYLVHIRRYEPLVLAVVRDRPEQFPFPSVYTPPLSKWKLLLTRADRRFLHRQRLAEPFFNRILQSRQAQILHAHFGYNGAFALPLHFSSGRPLVTTFYGVDVSRLPHQRRWRRSYRRLFEHGALFLAEGSHLKNQLIDLGCPSEKILIQRIGVDLKNFSYREAPPATGDIRILMCGRFVEKKGFEYGMRAFARICPEFPKSQLRIVGSGPLQSRLKSLIDGLKPEIRQRVVMLGRLSYDAYAEEAGQAHLFMAPSVTASDGDTEGGAPTVLLEMQARGLPVLATRHADIPEVVVDGASGYLVEERDDVALGDKLAELLAHPENWNKMGQAGRAHMEKQHDIIKLAQQLEKKYDGVLERGG